MKPVTLRDVAREINVSARTVSNVVNGFEHVSPEMRRRVQDACDRLGYRPNPTARSLKTGRTQLIAFVMPEISIPYFAELAQSIIRNAQQAGYGVLIEQTNGDSERERDLIRTIAGQRLFDGIIFSPLSISSEDLREGIGVPIVLLGEYIPDTDLDHVGIDNVAAAREATEHLLKIGRRRIAAVGAGAYGETADLRTRGFLEAHAAAGIAVEDWQLVHVDEFHRDAGADAMNRLLGGAPRPDALFCYNDLLAIGAARVALGAGLSIPDDLAIIGFDDIEEARYYTPALTSISPDKDSLAERAVARLVARIEARTEDDRSNEIIAYRLVQRETT